MSEENRGRRGGGSENTENMTFRYNELVYRFPINIILYKTTQI